MARLPRPRDPWVATQLHPNGESATLAIKHDTRNLAGCGGSVLSVAFLMQGFALLVASSAMLDAHGWQGATATVVVGMLLIALVSYVIGRLVVPPWALEVRPTGIVGRNVLGGQTFRVRPRKITVRGEPGQPAELRLNVSSRPVLSLKPGVDGEGWTIARIRALGEWMAALTGASFADERSELVRVWEEDPVRRGQLALDALLSNSSEVEVPPLQPEAVMVGDSIKLTHLGLSMKLTPAAIHLGASVYPWVDVLDVVVVGTGNARTELVLHERSGLILVSTSVRRGDTAEQIWLRDAVKSAAAQAHRQERQLGRQSEVPGALRKMLARD